MELSWTCCCVLAVNHSFIVLLLCLNTSVSGKSAYAITLELILPIYPSRGAHMMSVLSWSAANQANANCVEIDHS